MSELRQRPGDQPLPVPGEACVQDAVIADIQIRKQLGEERYGSALMSFNGRFTIQDAYEEAIDLSMYLKQILLEQRYGRRAVCVEVATSLRRTAENLRDEPGQPQAQKAQFAEEVADLLDGLGLHVEGPAQPTNFFVAGRLYEHEAEGIFRVKYVGRPPTGYGDASDALGVAFGWRMDARYGAVGVLPGTKGAYTTADFAGWVEL